MAEHSLHTSPKHLEAFVNLITIYLPLEEVWAYGSRINGSSHDTSDLDIVIRHPANLDARQTKAIRDLRTALRESNIPLVVDVLDWATLPVTFKESIAQQHIGIYHPT